MAILTKQPAIQVKAQTSQGEITVNLNLNIKIEQDSITVSHNKMDEKINWEIPDIEPSKIIEFGSKV